MRISYDSWPSIVARIAGPGVPTVTVAGGSIIIDGQRARATTGSGWDLRRKARTRTVDIAGHRYDLRPTGLRRARFTRDATPIAKAYGTFGAYNPFRSVPGTDARLTWTPAAEPLEVALGQAMAVAFGAGSLGLLTAIAVFWLDVLSNF